MVQAEKRIISLIIALVATVLLGTALCTLAVHTGIIPDDTIIGETTTQAVMDEQAIPPME